MEQELQALEGERQKMRHWKEKKWYEDRFQDQDPKDKFQSKSVEVLLNPSKLEWEQNVKYAFTHDAKKAFHFRRNILQDRFQSKKIGTAVGLLAVIISFLFSPIAGSVTIAFYIVGLITLGTRWWSEYQSTKAFLDVVDQLAFELTQDRLFRKGNASTHAAMSIKNILFFEELSLGMLIGSYRDPVNIKEDIFRAMNDPQWFLIPKTLHGYELIKTHLQEHATSIQ